jgi:hypothetical protein
MNPVLDASGVQAIVVVLAATVPAAVAHAGHEHFASRPRRAGAQEHAPSRVAGADVARDGPQRPGLVHDPSKRRATDSPLAIPQRKVGGGTCGPRRGHAIPHNGGCRSLRSVQGAGRSETGRGDADWGLLENHQPDVGYSGLERRHQHIIGGVTLRRWRTVGHRGVGDLIDHSNPGSGIFRIVRTEAGEKPDRGRQGVE